MTEFSPSLPGPEPQCGPESAASPWPERITVHALDPRHGDRQLSAAGEHTLMELLRDRGMSVMALCGGGMSCGTCHVHVPQPWAGRIAPASEEETAILEGCERYEPGRSRLSCQVRLEPALDGVRLAVIGE
ncbi:2Fe-2S iron-sulfur cluster-binding protein [Variovorax sp. M-6]|uniref:2Fe-2S iron-sulfur cluster-binding protein n=1 Tax=Variovorax sp. M-6 TaxID=3233041 RepID=UPI003F9A9704